MKGETIAGGASRTGPRVSGLAGFVRRHDPDRYRTALFAPADRRDALFALYAFNYEIARVRESVSEPMLGQIRLQWWREAIEAAYAGQPPRRHEVAAPLAAAIRDFGLTQRHFDRLIEGREHDLDDAPPATMAALEDYAEATSASLVLLALEILGVHDAAAEAAGREVGIAYALTGLIRAMPFHARAGRRYIPDDLAAGFDPRDYTALRVTPGLRKAVAAIADAAQLHLNAARRHKAPRAALPALLPAIVARRSLARLRATGNDPFDPQIADGDPLLVWLLLAASLAGRL